MSLVSNVTLLGIPNDTAPSQPHYDSSCIIVESAAEKISKLLVYCLLLPGSFLGNIFIIVIFYKHRDLHKTVNYFIVNMALSDLVYPLAVLPVQITAEATGSRRWHISGILGSIVCKLLYFANQVSLLVSAQSLVWIAIDRFVAVVFPIRLGLISTKVRIMAIASTWILAAAFNSPLLITSGLFTQGNDTFCGEVNVNSVFTGQEALAAYFWLQFIFYLVAPLLLVTFLYVVVIVALKRQSKLLTDPGLNIQRNSFKKRKRAIQLSAVTVALFYICVSPHTIFPAVINFWTPTCAFLKVLVRLVNFSVYSTTLVNPVICLSFVESYRRRLRNILCSCCKKLNRTVSKRVQIIHTEMGNRSGENYPRTSMDTGNYEETLDTVL